VRPPEIGELTAGISEALKPVGNVQLQSLQQPFHQAARRSLPYQLVNSLGEINGADGGPLQKLLHFLEARLFSD
jgi:hypothetical protein